MANANLTVGNVTVEYNDFTKMLRIYRGNVLNQIYQLRSTVEAPQDKDHDSKVLMLDGLYGATFVNHLGYYPKNGGKCLVTKDGIIIEIELKYFIGWCGVRFTVDNQAYGFDTFCNKGKWSDWRLAKVDEDNTLKIAAASVKVVEPEVEIKAAEPKPVTETPIMKQCNEIIHNLGPTIDPTVKAILQRIGVGFRNLYLHGPAGCGKTEMCRIVAELLGIPFVSISCTVGTSVSEFIGRLVPTISASEVSGVLGEFCIVVLDEMPMLSAEVAAVCNQLLANKIINTRHGKVERKCIIIATGNSLGNGADRQYVATNQLDASTKDRFVGGYIFVTYNRQYESRFDRRAVRFVEDFRALIDLHQLREIASTRMIIAAEQLLQIPDFDWRNALIEHCTEETKELLRKERIIA